MPQSESNNNWVYENTPDNQARFVLGEQGTNPLIVIGVNPSTAEPGNLDPTLKSVKRWAVKLGFDGWTMLNLYPQRSTNPKGLHGDNEFNYAYHAANLTAIGRHTIGTRTVWAAWGNLISTRKYLLRCLDDITRLQDPGMLWRWIHIGPLSKLGHPHHPLYLPKSSQLEQFYPFLYLRDHEEDEL